jgi:hypothetical protein
VRLNPAHLSQPDRIRQWYERDWNGRWARGEAGADYMESIRYMTGKRHFLAQEGYRRVRARKGGRRGGCVLRGGSIPFVLRPGGEGSEFEVCGGDLL